jgi:hypothetical protein
MAMYSIRTSLYCNAYADFFPRFAREVAPWPRFFSHGRENFLDVMAGAALDESSNKGPQDALKRVRSV